MRAGQTTAPRLRLVLWRPDIHCGDVEVDVKKVRFRQAWHPGIVRFMFDEFSGRFVERTELESVSALRI